MGTSTQLSVVIGGSVVLGGGDEEPAIVPLATDATPTVKSSPNKTGRYTSLSVLLGSSEGVWPAAVSVDGGGWGKAERTAAACACRAAARLCYRWSQHRQAERFLRTCASAHAERYPRADADGAEPTLHLARSMPAPPPSALLSVAGFMGNELRFRVLSTVSRASLRRRAPADPVRSLRPSAHNATSGPACPKPTC
ncbi:hypothetical protein AB1Y20_020605 [Prymnesium parvum]|uniref:Uncharacterized protein n=1 Tax=Prymnesium parvum TaxID=97485 RepID=A0AB34JXW7_PRYPA